MVRAGNSWRVIATSPKARSRSTRTTRLDPFSLSATARFTASVVLPTPPLGENTVTWRPRLPPTSTVAPFRACHTCWARVTAEPRPVRSRSSTTSRIPERSASASTLVSTRRRIRMTLMVGRVTRRLSARAAADSRSIVGPMTMACSSGICESSRLRSSRLLTTREEEPATVRMVSAVAGLGSTTMGIRSPEQVGLGDAVSGLHLGLVIEEAERQGAVLGREHDLLRLGLVDGQRVERRRDLLRGLRALLGGRGRGGDGGLSDRDHLDRRDQEAEIGVLTL